MKAVDSRDVDTYQEFVERVNASLRSNGIEKRSYTNIVEQMKSFFDLHNTSETAELDNLSDKKQRIIKTHVENPSLTVTELAEKADVHQSYPNQVIEKYGYLIDELEEKMDDENSNVVSPMSHSKLQNQSSLYDNQCMTEESLNIVEYFANNPTSETHEVADELGYSVSYVSNIEDKYIELTLNRAKELGKNANALNEKLKELEQRQAQK
jgi:DNA-binding MarR family transcriptional regulator